MAGPWPAACYHAPPLSMLINPNQRSVSLTLPLRQGHSHWAHPALIEHVFQEPAVPGIALDPSLIHPACHRHGQREGKRQREMRRAAGEMYK